LARRADLVPKDVLRKKIVHRRITYLFQWNQSNHKLLMSNAPTRDSASSLWRFLERVYNDDIPHEYFWRNDFKRASMMKLASIPKSNGVGLVYKLAREGLVNLESHSDLLSLVKKVSSSSRSHGSVLSFLINFDPHAVSSETPVYDEKLKMTGHIDLVRITPTGNIQVLDFKPGLKDVDLFLAMPQVATYGILLGKLLKDAQDHVECILFNTQESISFQPSLLKRLPGSDVHQGLLRNGKKSQLHQSTLDSLF
jgi:hypothetical protein